MRRHVCLIYVWPGPARVPALPTGARASPGVRVAARVLRAVQSKMARVPGAAAAHGVLHDLRWHLCPDRTAYNARVPETVQSKVHVCRSHGVPVVRALSGTCAGQLSTERCRGACRIGA